MRLKEWRFVIAQPLVQRLPLGGQFADAAWITNELDLQLTRRVDIQSGVARYIVHLTRLVSSSRACPGRDAYPVIDLTPLGADGSTRKSTFAMRLRGSIAKIAHGAAVAELGFDAFVPLLPDAILGKDRYVSHLVGGSFARARISF